MHPKISRARLVRAGLIAAMLSIGGALIAYASLPLAADDGQARAAAGAANGQASHSQADEHPAEDAGLGTTAAADRLAENQARLFATLNDVLDRLTANDNVPDAAIDALRNVIERLGGDIGLNRAMDAVGGSTAHPDHPDLLDAATDHPGKP